jgi:hypothetical protein
VSSRPASIDDGVADSIAYLGSDAALESLAIDVYWPKWHSPWWHMLLLWELGLAKEIPARASAAVAAGVDGLLHTFPITEAELAGVNPQRDIPCHCALGTMAQVLAACGHDVDRELPWVRPWFQQYQMADGGLTCDETAYRVVGECPSSMVGTVPPLEATLALGLGLGGDRAFADGTARFLIGRELVDGSATVHNAAERESAKRWPLLTFPRFYFYDVLRGLTALARWARATGEVVPGAAIRRAVAIMDAKPPGELRVERREFAAHPTLVPTRDRSPSPRAPSTTFPLLDAVSVIGEPSGTLTREWAETRELLALR